MQYSGVKFPENDSVYELLECASHGRGSDDDIWLLLRMKPTGLTPATVMAQSVPGWSNYNIDDVS